MAELTHLVPINLDSFRVPEIKLPTSVTNPAKWAYEQIVQSIIVFEAKLDNDHEIGGRLVGFAGNEVIHIEDVGYMGPHLIKFFGRTIEGFPVELIQHVTQISVMLVAMKKETEKPRRIGFELHKHLSG